MNTLSESYESAQTPCRLAYLTSLREIFGSRGQEFVGQHIEGLGYRMGNLEALSGLISHSREQLSQLLEIGLVIFDDTPQQIQAMGIDRDHPYQPGNWPWPHDLPNGNGQNIHEITYQVPLYSAEWRKARRRKDSETAQNIRRSNEEQLAQLLKDHRIDLILTDSITYIFQPDMALLRDFRGRILNFHPAFLDNTEGTAIPGLYPTESALMRYREGKIKGEGGRIIEVPHLKGYNRHGSTLHQTVAEIDEGPIIHAEENIVIQEDDTQQSLRHRVFEAGHEVLRRGLLDFLLRKKPRQVNAEARLQNVS